MAENTNAVDNGCFKEAVCIDAGRVFDSCCDRDCLEDLRCYFSPDSQSLVNTAIGARIKCAEVLNVYIDVEPVNFKRGFYSCDLTFFFLVGIDLFMAPHSCPQTVNGIATFSKRVILFGGEGNVKVFSSEISDNCDTFGQTATSGSNNAPKCVVQSVDPVALSARIGEVRDCYDSNRCIPQAVCDRVGGAVVTDCGAGTPTVYVTLGLFTIVQIIRNVQMLVPVYDYCIPEKQCDDTTDQPCDVFRRIKFPTDDFFPAACSENDMGDYFGCCRCTDRDA